MQSYFVFHFFKRCKQSLEAIKSFISNFAASSKRKQSVVCFNYCCEIKLKIVTETQQLDLKPLPTVQQHTDICFLEKKREQKQQSRSTKKKMRPCKTLNRRPQQQNARVHTNAYGYKTDYHISKQTSEQPPEGDGGDTFEARAFVFETGAQRR